jgi:hypothetical protein
MAQNQNTSRFTYRRPANAPVAPKPPAPRKAAPIVHGAPDLWTALQTMKDPETNASKTTRAMDVPGGVVINTCTRGSSFAAEALVFVPGVAIMKSGKTGYLVAKTQ